jgi:hypothetical protein
VLDEFVAPIPWGKGHGEKKAVVQRVKWLRIMALITGSQFYATRALMVSASTRSQISVACQLGGIYAKTTFR